jgi:uncharacterized protein (TIGR02271 family)
MIKFNIKKEQLDIAKEWMQTGEVNISRETITEEKSFTVPIKREELVIKKRDLTNVSPQPKDNSTAVIRILLNEEQVEFNKHMVELEDVSIYKQQIQDIKHIEETLKGEETMVNKIGNADIVDIEGHHE